MHTAQGYGHTLTWEEHSQGSHTFIFINGFSTSRRSWLAILPYFEGLGRCVTLDLPGHYPAQTPPDYHTLSQELLLDLETEAVQQICDGRSATLIGHSTGGLVALAVAARLPAQVKRVVSIDGVVWGPLGGLLGMAHWLLRNHLYPAFWLLWRLTQIAPCTLMYGLTHYTHRKVALWRNSTAWQLCRETHPWYRRQSLRNLATLLKMLEVCDIRPLITSLSTPALALTGDHDPVVPPEQAHWLAQHLPNATLKVLKDTGHIPQIETTDPCLQIILNWLATQPV